MATRKLYENGNQVKPPKFDSLRLDHYKFPENQKVKRESGIGVPSVWSLTDTSLEDFPSTNKISQIRVNCW